jgi:septal ring factor EnvC (AmiA/AmiB activator)
VIPVWFRPWMAWPVLVGLVAAFAVVQTLRLSDEQLGHAVTREARANDRAQWERQTREAVEAARTEEQRRTAEVQKAVDDAEKQLARARADFDAAVDVGARLRQRISELTSVCGKAPSGAAPARSGSSAGSTADLLADVRRRIDEAAEGIAGYADKASAAGVACEQSYDGLTPKAP